MNKLSHVDEHGKANMVDVGMKPNQFRTAKAKGIIKVSAETIKNILENKNKKGDVLTVAKIAGIQAAKQTSSLIPLCHPLLITKIDVETNVLNDCIEVIAITKCIGQTGIEMEALTAVSVTLLTIYDMCKAIDKTMIIDDIHLIEKTKSDNLSEKNDL